MIVLGSTLASYKTGGITIGYGPEETLWLGHGEILVDDARAAGHELQFMVALELDRRGMGPFEGILKRLAQIEADTGAHAEVWTFSMDTGAEKVSSDERLAHICMGRNLVTEYAMRANADKILFADSDTVMPPDAISKLCAVDWPITGGEVPSYYGPNGLGPWGEAAPVPSHPMKGTIYDFPVTAHWNTAGFLLVDRLLFSKLRWRSDLRAGLSDDPCYAQDALTQGYITLVRGDVQGMHDPLTPVELRDADLTIYR